MSRSSSREATGSSCSDAASARRSAAPCPPGARGASSTTSAQVSASAPTDGSSVTRAPAMLPTRCGSWSSSTRTQAGVVRRRPRPGRQPGSSSRSTSSASASRSPKTTNASSAPGWVSGGAGGTAVGSARPARRRRSPLVAKPVAPMIAGPASLGVEGRPADHDGRAGLADRLDLPAGEGRNADSEQLSSTARGPELVDVPDQTLRRGVRAEVADGEALGAQVLGHHQGRAARATPARRTRRRPSARPGGGAVGQLALDGERGQHRLADRGGGVLLRDAPRVGDPQLADPQLRGCEQPLDQRQHVVALGRAGRAPARARHVRSPRPTLRGRSRPRSSQATSTVTRLLGLDGQDGDVVVGPVAQVARTAPRRRSRPGRWRRRRRCPRAPARSRSSPNRARWPGASGTPSV